jgi:hypothetical protein
VTSARFYAAIYRGALKNSVISSGLTGRPFRQSNSPPHRIAMRLLPELLFYSYEIGSRSISISYRTSGA